MEWRTSSIAGRDASAGTDATPERRTVRRVSIASAPSSRRGRRTVVSAGLTPSARALSPSPTTERSPGTESPRCRAARSAPVASRSVAAKMAVGRSARGRSRRRPARALPPFHGEVGRGDESRIGPQEALVQGPAHPRGLELALHQRRRAGDDPDPLVPEVEQMAQGQVGRPGAIDHHPRAPGGGAGRRPPPPPRPPERPPPRRPGRRWPGRRRPPGRPRRAQQQQAPGVGEPQVAGVRHLPLRMLLGVAHEEEVAGAPAHLLGAPQHPRQVGMVAVPRQDAHDPAGPRVRGPRGQGPGHGRGDEVERRRRQAHSLLGLRPHPVPAGREDAGDGGHRDPCPQGDVGDPRLPCPTPTLRPPETGPRPLRRCLVTVFHWWSSTAGWRAARTLTGAGSSSSRARSRRR